MVEKIIQLPSSHYPKGQSTSNRCNRTGATVVRGSVGFVDLPQADGDSTSIELGQDNVVAVTTARIAQLPLLLVSTGTAADDARVEWHEGDCLECVIRVEGTVAVAKGDKLKPVNAQTYLVKATVGTDYWFAVALEAQAAASVVVIRCLLFTTGRR